MISTQTAARQVTRFAVFPQYSKLGETGEGELIAALRNASANEHHAVSITDRLVQSAKYLPTPADIYATADALPAGEFNAKPSRDCSACGGTGYMQVWQLVTSENNYGGSYKRREVIRDASAAAELKRKVDGHTQVVYDCVTRCTECAYGTAMAHAENMRARDESHTGK